MSSLMTAFSILYATGFIVTPLFGWAQDKFQLHACTACVIVASIAWQTLWLAPSIPLQYLTFAIYSSTRQVLFSWYYSAVAAVCGYRFYGSLLAVTSVSNTVLGLMQPIIVSAAITSSNFDAMNSAFLATMLIVGAACCSALTLSYHRIKKAVQSQQLLQNAV
jgi:hypothetical protein